jgi:hypothetical protein
MSFVLETLGVCKNCGLPIGKWSDLPYGKWVHQHTWDLCIPSDWNTSNPEKKVAEPVDEGTFVPMEEKPYDFLS